MKIALISDIHANLPAFEAVLKHAKEKGVEDVWHLGDCVGYGPFPNETISLLRSQKIKNILGNYDQKVLEFSRKQDKWRKEKDSDKFFSFQWTYGKLPLRLKHYLKSLPEHLTFQEGVFAFCLVHGSPETIDEALTEQTPYERFLELTKMTEANVILCGHSHRYFDKVANKIRFINPGSVGRSFDGDVRASYAVLDIQESALRCENFRVSYDLNHVLTRMKNERFPKNLIDSIRLGRSLDELKEEEKKAKERETLKEVYRLAESCHYEREHAEHVSFLALSLFDQLQGWHGLGAQERFWLQCASILHDIGWIAGRKRHHKIARDIILRSTSLPLSSQERVIVALIARYHRRALPSNEHGLYHSLIPNFQKVVCILSSFLRIADGLDSTHRHLVKDVRCEVQDKYLIVHILSQEIPEDETDVSKRKANLFEKFFKKEFFTCHTLVKA